jgi:hypothetical protein
LNIVSSLSESVGNSALFEYFTDAALTMASKNCLYKTTLKY